METSSDSGSQGGKELAKAAHWVNTQIFNLNKYTLQFGQIHFQFGQIYFAIWTNTLFNLGKYIVQFGQIHFQFGPMERVSQGGTLGQYSSLWKKLNLDKYTLQFGPTLFLNLDKYIFNLGKYIVQFGQMGRVSQGDTSLGQYSQWTNVNLDKNTLKFGPILCSIWTNTFSIWTNTF